MVSINREPLILIIISAWVIYRILAVKRSGLNLLREIVLNLFLVYCLVVFSFTFFPIDITLFSFNVKDANLIPFNQTIRYLQRLDSPVAVRNLAGNLLLLTPLGITLPTLFKKMDRFLRITAIGFATTLTIETFQMFLLARVFDIDDIILNTLGVMIGFGIFSLLLKLPIIRQGVQYTAVEGNQEARRLFFWFCGAILFGFVLIASMAVIQSTKTIDEFKNDLSSGGTYPVHAQEIDHFALALVEEDNEIDQLVIIYEVGLRRYVMVDWIDDLNLEENEYRLTDLTLDGWKMDYFAVARSVNPVETMQLGGDIYPVVSIGDYHFAHAEIDPQNQSPQIDSLRFFSENGTDLGFIYSME